jgi:hypothetical protein
MLARNRRALRRTHSRAPACEGVRKLLDIFVAAVRYTHKLSKGKTRAALAGDGSLDRFDPVIKVAAELRKNAKWALVLHIQEHGCIPNIFDLTR